MDDKHFTYGAIATACLFGFFYAHEQGDSLALLIGDVIQLFAWIFAVCLWAVAGSYVVWFIYDSVKKRFFVNPKHQHYENSKTS